MSYNPTQGVIVDGEIIEADDLMNEFNAIAVETNALASQISTQAAQTEQAAKSYTDTTVAAAVATIDGGTF